jgi:UDP-N-acetylglucosamine 2-epimerase (non-hydrolysing)
VGKKVMIVFGTRPEAIKLFPVIDAVRARSDLSLRVVSSGQHRDLLDQAMAITGIVPDIDLALMTPGQTLEVLVARLIAAIGDVLRHERPDRVVVQGDTSTAMAAALAAHHLAIPVSHVEAGLRSGDLAHPWPEEANRRIIALLADQHFAPTERAAEALRGEGIDPATIHVTGNTGIDALRIMRARLADRPALAAALDPVLAKAGTRRIVLVTIHRRENWQGLDGVAAALATLAARPDCAIVLPLHPNPALDPLRRIAGVTIVPPLDYPQFVRLLARAHLVLTDSGGVQEEAPAFGVPVLVMRDTTERPEGIVAGTARLVGTDRARIVTAASTLLDDSAAWTAMARAHNPFGDGHAAPRIAALIADRLSG